MGNKHPVSVESDQLQRQSALPLPGGSTLSIPLLRSFLGEAPPVMRESYTNLTVHAYPHARTPHTPPETSLYHQGKYVHCRNLSDYVFKSLFEV